MPFSEICIYQVKPDKVEEFEALMKEAVQFMQKLEGVLQIRFIKRTHSINDFSLIKKGLPPHKITRIVKGVRYMLYWEFDTIENYGNSQKSLYESYWNSIEKCLVVPHDKYLGEEFF
jgi:hypothetical protein